MVPTSVYIKIAQNAQRMFNFITMAILYILHACSFQVQLLSVIACCSSYFRSGQHVASCFKHIACCFKHIACCVKHVACCVKSVSPVVSVPRSMLQLPVFHYQFNVTCCLACWLLLQTYCLLCFCCALPVAYIKYNRHSHFVYITIWLVCTIRINACRVFLKAALMSAEARTVS